MFRSMMIALGLKLIGETNRRKLLGYDKMLNASSEVHTWCGGELPLAADVAEYIRTSALGYENRVSDSNRPYMTPREVHHGIGTFRQALYAKYPQLLKSKARSE